jgi:hypothetical protein
MGAHHARPFRGRCCDQPPHPADNKPIEKILFLITVAYFIAWLAIGAQALGTWHRQRSHPGVGRDLMEPGPPAVDN